MTQSQEDRNIICFQEQLLDHLNYGTPSHTPTQVPGPFEAVTEAFISIGGWQDLAIH